MLSTVDELQRSLKAQMVFADIIAKKLDAARKVAHPVDSFGRPLNTEELQNELYTAYGAIDQTNLAIHKAKRAS
jgi:hypothetical protein